MEKQNVIQLVLKPTLSTRLKQASVIAVGTALAAHASAASSIDATGLTGEIDGGKETVATTLPLIIGAQKGLVEEKDLRIPNMRGIMTARTKALTVLEPIEVSVNTKATKFEKPAPRSAVKLIATDNLDELINLLHNEAKVI